MTTLLIALVALTPVQTKVACVGASITSGVGTSNKETMSYPAQLQRLLGSGYEVKNFGNSGRAVTKTHPNSYWNTSEFQAAKAFSPNIVIINLGTNDAIPEYWPKVQDAFVTDLQDMIKVFRNLPSHPKVYVTAPTPVFNEPRHQNLEEEVLPLVRQSAREVAAPIIDFHNALAGHSEWFPDQLHPNDDGAWAMALEAYFTLGDTKPMKSGWKLVAADSVQADEGPAKNAFDGDSLTYWHTQWSPKSPKHPHQLVIDLGKEMSLAGVRLTPRQDGGVNGRIKEAEVFVSSDGVEWSLAVWSGVIADKLSPSTIMFSEKHSGRFLKLVAKSEHHGGPWTTLGEIDIVPARQ